MSASNFDLHENERMQKSAVVKTIHGCFLAPKNIPTENESGSDTEDETDEDDYNIELGDSNLSSGGSGRTSVSRARLKKITGIYKQFVITIISSYCFLYCSVFVCLQWIETVCWAAVKASNHL